MILLNLGCGGNRPVVDPWINIDNLNELFPGSHQPERQQLDSEFNYLNTDLRNGIPFVNGSVNGVLMSHLLEHLDCHECVKLLKDVYRVLVPGGVARISVPDPQKFYEMSVTEVKTGTPADWGEPNNGTFGQTFMDYALFFYGHKQLLSLDSLNCMLFVSKFIHWVKAEVGTSLLNPLADIDNRATFSLFIEAVK